MDRWLAERCHDLVRDHPVLADGLRAVTDLGRPQTLVLAAAILGAGLWLRGRPRAAAVLVSAALGAWLLNVGIKDVVDRARPALDGEPLVRTSGASFPSGHAMVSAAAYGAAALLARRRGVTIVAGVLVGLIAVSRVGLGVHWPSDVVVGVVLGVAWAWACARALVRGEEDLRPRDREAPEDLPGAPGRDGEAQPR